MINLGITIDTISSTKKPAWHEETFDRVWPVGLVAWFSLRVREVTGSTPGQALTGGKIVELVDALRSPLT